MLKVARRCCMDFSVRRRLSQYSGSIHGALFKKTKISFATRAHIHFCMLKLTLKSAFCYECWIFILIFFRLSCRSHHNPAPFCYIIKHVFKVSYKLTYFVVVNKILTVYLTCFSVCFFFYLVTHVKTQMSKNRFICGSQIYRLNSCKP